MGSDLHVTRVDRERDSGQFTCIAVDTTGRNPSITSSPASLNIQWIGEASVQLQEPQAASFIQRGGDVILRCHMDATGDVHYEWFRNAERLEKTPNIDIKKKRLHIKHAKPSDNGVYRCAGRNEAGIEYSVKNYALAVPGGEDTAIIQVVPSNQLVKRGSTAFFDCSYKNVDVIEWYFKDSGPLESNDRITIHPNNTLQVNEVQESDEGLYSCVGIQSESTEIPQTYAAELKLAYIREFRSTSFEPALPESSKKIVAENSPFQLTCLEPDSIPMAKKWWQNQSGHTISDTGDVRVDDDGRLIIDNVQLKHAGIYSCVAESIAGKTEKSFELIVTTKPEITRHPTSITVDENDRSVLTCAFATNSEPYTIVRWRKDGKLLKYEYDPNSMHTPRIRIYKDNGTLIINSTQTQDRGEYICEVVTTGFQPVASNPATISVIEQLRFSPPPVNKKMELGSVAKIHCKAQGTPPPNIHWEKEGVRSENLSSHITDMNGTLHFNGVQAEDKGRYSCIASNSQGTIQANITIEVVVAPKFTLLPKNPTEVIEGQPVALDCVVEGDPKPTIQWDKNSKMNDFDSTRFTVLKNGTLLISEVHKDDENKYGCTGGNSGGLNRKEIQLIVHSRDGFHPDELDGDSTVTKAVLITMSVAGAYIILVVGLMVWCRYRRRSRKLPIGDAAKTENGDVEHTELKDGTNGHIPGPSKVETNGIEAHKEGQRSDGAETTHSQSSNNSKKSKSNYDKIALSRSHLKELKLIGRGEFGDCMVGKISKSAIDNRNSQATTPTEDKELIVLVKCLTQTKDEDSLAEFKREIDMFTKLSHDNITKLYGLCREVEPHYMILEHTDWGDLKQFLVATKKGNSPALTPVQCVGIIHQLSRGMEHLSNARMIHRDLAARNCLVTSTLIAKVGIPRLTRDPYSQEYCKHVNQIIPLRWLPYEAVYEDDYSTKSDVYSFGVVMYEIFSQGELPFPKINDNSFLTKLKEKKLEWKANDTTPESLQPIQESCWNMNPQDRPTFSQLSKDVEEILKSM
ncbi:tyrosine-protein kinase-like otk isoform X2 [Aethina tumida]|nr:tyrosine-protein kinase-like otk isoform X2 [Aethina tumida]